MSEEFDTGERLYVGVSHVDNDVILEHRARYAFAKRFIKPGNVVVDAASGSGYGSDELASIAEKVTGLEVSDHALEYAKNNFKDDNVVFVKADLNAPLPLVSGSVDVVVSFETLEHIDDQESFFGEVARILKPGGTFIVSTPDKDLISGGLLSDNPFHIKELNKSGFIALAQKYFVLEKLYGQTQKVTLSFSKESIKKLRNITFLRKIKQFFAKKLGLTNYFHHQLAGIAYTPIVEVSLNEENYYYVLIAVCAKKA